MTVRLAAIDPGVTSPAVATSWGVLSTFKPPKSVGLGAARLVWLADAHEPHEAHQ